VDCHNTHALTVKVELCGGCHPSVTSAEELTTIRISPTDYNGNGDTQEGIAAELASFQEAEYAAMQAYALDTVGTGIYYNGARYPYYFVDANGNGQGDPDETDTFNSWTPRLLKGAYNYQYATKDPGAFAHNAKYIMQVLYDSAEDLGGDVSAFTRP
jgi:hypothetical protein